MKSRIFHSFTAKLAVAFWILTGLAAIWHFWPVSVDRGAEIVADETTSVSESHTGFTIPIEKITVGMRVHAHNPELSDPERETIVEPDWSNFSVLDVEMTKTDGGIVEISLLRSPEWMEQHKPVVGGTVPVASAEFDAMGESKIIAVRAGPEVSNDPGHVVTATFKHLSSEVLDLYVEGNDMPLGTTANHPFWSVDRKRFVEASKLRRGETLRTMFDENLKLRFINKRISKEPVYNFTVYGEHTYFVGDDALLVHNNGGYDDDNIALRNHKGEPVKIPRGHIMSPKDPDISAPPIVEKGPFTTAQRNAFLAGNSAGTKLAPHHRHQIPTTHGGVIDELPGPAHPSGNIHTKGSPSRHPSPSIFNSLENGAALRKSEIFENWQAKGQRLVEVEPGLWIDPGF